METVTLLGPQPKVDFDIVEIRKLVTMHMASQRIIEGFGSVQLHKVMEGGPPPILGEPFFHPFPLKSDATYVLESFLQNVHVRVRSCMHYFAVIWSLSHVYTSE
jgi:hypothetical protein